MLHEPLPEHALEGGMVEVAKGAMQRHHTWPALPAQPQRDADLGFTLAPPLTNRVQAAAATQQRPDLQGQHLAERMRLALPVPHIGQRLECGPQ